MSTPILADQMRTRDISWSRSQTVGDLLRRSASRHPDKLAVVDGETSFTYREFDETVNRFARALHGRGVRHGDRVGLLSHNCWQFVAIAFASARLGSILVPINFMLTAEEIAYILDHSGATSLFVESLMSTVATTAIALSGGGVQTRGTFVVDGAPPAESWERVDDWFRDGDGRPVEVFVGDDDVIRLMYTSGTESRPKGAMLSSKSLIAQYASAIVDGGMSGDDVDLHALPFYHCAQLDCFLGPDIYLGATNVILRRPQPEAVLRSIAEHGVTKFFAPPTVWISLLRADSLPDHDLSSLTKGYYGASPMPVEILREIFERFPGLALWNFYGQTELAPVATILGPRDQVDRAGSAGRPVLNVETRIVDDDDNEVGPGTVGEVVHRSPHATLGYWNDPDKTADAFRNGWFHSGDLGIYDRDGYITIVDRKKDMIKTGGENVASREIEEVIYLHPAVAEVAVFAVPDEKWVEAVTAVVVLKRGAALAEDDLAMHCRAALAGYKRPKRIHIVESLPKNPSGKILKRELRQAYSART